MTHPTPLPPAAAAAPSAALRVDGSQLLRLLLGLAASLVAAHLLVVASYAAGWEVRGARRFYLDQEGNVPTFFSSALLLLAGWLLALIASLRSEGADAFRGHWRALAAVFALLALDEAASFHEALIEPLRHAFGLSGVLRFPWVLAGMAFSALVLLASLRFLSALPRPTRVRFLAAGGVYLLGAIGFEMVGGVLFDAPGKGSAPSLPYMLAMTVEESLELAGVLLFLRALLLHLKGHAPAVLLRFE